MLTKEQRQEIIDKWFFYTALAIAEAKKLEAEAEPKRIKKINASDERVLARRRAQRYKK